MKERNESKITFKIYYSYFEYQFMSFGLTNALVISQSYKNKILVEKLDIFIIMYHNNIFVYTKNKGKEHIKAV